MSSPYVRQKKITWRHFSTPIQALPHAFANYANSSAFLAHAHHLVVLAHSFFRLSDLRAEGNATAEEIEALRMECSTWALLQAVMPCV
jgi:hypothetical protein